MQREPRTEAGRRLLNVPFLAGEAEAEGVGLAESIVAIEQEAAALDPERLTEVLRRLHNGGEQPRPMNAWQAWVYRTWSGPRQELTPKGFAQIIAAEYARLSLEDSAVPTPQTRLDIL